jgi:hypothetical protein
MLGAAWSSIERARWRRTCSHAGPATTLTFYTTVADIQAVVAGGRVRKRDGHLTDVDVGAVRAQASKALLDVERRFQRLPRERFESVWSRMF